MAGKRDEVTIAEVAEALNISKTTVSRAISGKGRVSEATRARVFDYIGKGRQDAAAPLRTAQQGPTNNLALVIPKHFMRLDLPFLRKCMGGVWNMAAQRGYDLLLCYDTGHWTFSEVDPLAILEKFPNRIGHVHLKNMRKPLRDQAIKESWSFLKSVRNGCFTVPGDPEGCVDFPAVLKKLDEIGYEGWIMVEAEQDPAKANPFKYAKMAYEYITAEMAK